MVDINKTLEDRGTKYGDFKIQAGVAQNIKASFRNSPNWKKLDPASKDALEMIAVKISRLLNGDYTDKDTWHDIIGYAKLIERDL